MSLNIKLDSDVEGIDAIIEADNDYEVPQTSDRRSYSRKYYEHNKEKAKAACRTYSAKVRADPVKREQINAQKREMMRRLAHRRRLEKGLPPKSATPQDSTSVRRRNHKEYYAENIEKMRESNRRYSAKCRADPEKRAAINEKKKLCMRRLKERRSMETIKIEFDDSLTTIRDNGEMQTEDGLEDYVLAADQQAYIIEEVVYNDDDHDDQEEEEIQIQAAEVFQEPEPVERFEDVFPETINILRSLDGGSRSHFIAYMERCARNYLP